MEPYRNERNRQDRRSTLTGAVATALVHAAALFVAFTTGLNYLYPPPPETNFIIDFQEREEPEPPVPAQVGEEPQMEEPDIEKPVELTQEAQSPHVNTAPNKTPQTQENGHGDVEVPAPPVKEEPKLDPRAAFPGMARTDSSTTAAHAAKDPFDAFKAGQPDGNTDLGRTSGAPNAHLKGRSVKGTLKKPEYNSQTEGIVVVEIKVDQYGNVTEARPGADGTTVTDKNLWTAARKAAMEAHFNQSAEAPVVQTGTITYIFKLQ